MLEIERRISPHKRTRNFIHGNAEVSRLEFEISEAKFPMSVMDSVSHMIEHRRPWIEGHENLSRYFKFSHKNFNEIIDHKGFESTTKNLT